MKQQKRILKIEVKRKYDSDPDTSYLEQEKFEDRYVPKHGYLSDEDAHLIAAAPELLEALKAAVAALENVHKEHPEEYWLGSEYNSAKQAIAKATGAR